MRQSGGLIAFLSLLLGALRIAVGDGQAPYSVSRDFVLSKACGNLVVHLFDGKPAPVESQAVADAVVAEVKRDAPQILPASIQSPSKEIMDMVLSTKVPVEFDDPEYIRARVRLYLYGIPTRINILANFPPMSAQVKAQVAASLAPLVSKVQSAMEAKLLPLSIPEINQASLRDAVN